jgi:hypothetical protein
MASDAAAESTHSFMPVIVMRAMLSCATSSRRAAACCAATVVRFGVSMTVVICASAVAAPKTTIAANVPRPSHVLTVPPGYPSYP